MKFYDGIKLDDYSNEPKYVQLYEKLKNLIEDGAIKPNEKLPTIRELSKKLGVNASTVVNAYRLLEQKGYIYTKVGSGTYVLKKSEEKIEFFSENITVLHKKDEFSINEGINFSTLTPHSNLFPVDEFKLVINKVLDRDGAHAFTYADPQGYYFLRESITDYLKECGIETQIENVSIISGAQQGIDLVAKALINFNDTIVVESPTYTGAVAVFKNRGANIIEVPILEDGIDIDELEEVLKRHRVKLIYVMPNFQNPTSITYSFEKKLALLNLAQKYNVFILEDDFLTEVNFGNKDAQPLKSLDFCDRVIFIKSFSKIFMPGLRIAVLVSPLNMSKNLIFLKQNSDISTSSLIQRAFDLYIREGFWTSHLKKLKDIYFERYMIMKENLSKLYFVDFKEPYGGIHFWIKTDIDSSILAYFAKKNGVILAPGNVFYLDSRSSNNIRLSFAQTKIDEIKEGIRILKECYEKNKLPG
ncbi:DNA-binding transcriptional regulator, MocR family, contains an aminotransferase domain [Caloramator fervidus]|uniref:DNA-binding transcriptional regulator, MocR family, contains an aminotransferase domain n=1 Tax=Caloramator fervidus TaxID=29344 RepID=A0A1H5SX10_9CLOT|nr:PLP-dependent aminotransferase family protein [Caloramator fervidus]SEF54307.1 DNA-binding transcriptional regulator, MocR family, contains an aminotransferase domain [Caloramator fervidus]